MPARGRTVELITTKEIDLFLPIMRELADDFGDRFLLSMLHWCGIGKRANPLLFWEVFLLRSNHEIVGLCGLYKMSETPASLAWLGWFGIRPAFRRRGYGSSTIHSLSDRTREMDCNELWVYTSPSDEAARHFYTKLGFQLLGLARDYAPGKTMDDSDVVLKLSLLRDRSLFD
jgi:RimJ/RimL family protein N-acetyltransferase